MAFENLSGCLKMLLSKVDPGLRISSYFQMTVIYAESLSFVHCSKTQSNCRAFIVLLRFYRNSNQGFQVALICLFFMVFSELEKQF